MDESDKKSLSETTINSEKSSISNLLTEGMAIAILTVGAYWMAYYLEKSYFAYFGIPDVFVFVTLDSAIKRFYELTIFLMVSYVLLSRIPKNLWAHIRWSAPSIFGLWFTWSFYLTSGFSFWTILFGLSTGFTLIVSYVYPIFRHKTLYDKFVRVNSKSIDERLQGFPKSSKFLFWVIIGTMSIITVGPIAGWIVGTELAGRQKQFSVLNDNGQWLVIDQDNGYFVAAGYDPATGAVTGKTRLISNSEAAGLIFETKQINNVIRYTGD